MGDGEGIEMSQPYYFNHSIRNLLAAFMYAFKDIHVKRFDDKGNEVKDILVPIKFGPMSKYFQRRTEDGSMKRYYVQLPTMAVTINGFRFAQDRSVSSRVRRYLPNPDFEIKDPNEETTLNDVSDPNRVITDMMPTPCDITFTLHIKTESLMDFTQIVEQIAPWFNPSSYLQVKEFNTKNLNRNVKITLESLDTEFTEPVEEEGKRYINGTMTFVADYWFYKPLGNSGVIEKIKMHYGYGTDYLLGENFETDGVLWSSVSGVEMSGTSSKGKLDGPFISNPLMTEEDLGYVNYQTSATE